MLTVAMTETLESHLHKAGEALSAGRVLMNECMFDVHSVQHNYVFMARATEDTELFSVPINNIDTMINQFYDRQALISLRAWGAIYLTLLKHNVKLTKRSLA